MNNQAVHSSGLTPADIQTLTKDFPRESIGVKVQSLSSDKTRAMLVQYLQHTDVAARLDTVDPSWTCEALDQWQANNTYYVRMRLTVKEVSRENVGEGDDPKSAYSDALKRSAMLFGVGRSLYDQETVWVPYHPQNDKYRQWTMNDYEAARRPRQTASQSQVAQQSNPAKQMQSFENVQRLLGHRTQPRQIASAPKVEEMAPEPCECGAPMVWRAGARAFGCTQFNDRSKKHSFIPLNRNGAGK